MAVNICPPYTTQSALPKVKAAEHGWNSFDPVRCASAYTVDCEWRNQAEFCKGTEAIIEFITRKWEQELDYQLMKELWCYTGNRMSMSFEYQWHETAGQRYRTHGNEHWEFTEVHIREHDPRYLHLPSDLTRR